MIPYPGPVCRASPASPRRQAGISLLEVLVAILVTSLGLLGLGGLQASGLRTTTGAYYRSQAVALAQDMTERLRTNPQAALAGQYNLAMEATVTAETSLADRDRKEWLALLLNLPGGDGAITVNGTGVVRVVVQWDDRRGGGGTDADLGDCGCTSTTCRLCVDTRI